MQIVEIDHEKILNIMQAFNQGINEFDPLWTGYRAGISKTLDLLGIRIDGVNWYPSNDEDGDAE